MMREFGPVGVVWRVANELGELVARELREHGAIDFIRTKGVDAFDAPSQLIAHPSAHVVDRPRFKASARRDAL